jgi:uncharacterized coiled-coil DUF342 family protein
MKQDYTPGEKCQCSAYNESECGCGAVWTPREVYELRDKAERYRLEANALMMQRDRLVEELNELKEECGLRWAQKRIAIDELKDVTEQRDRLLVEREQWRMSSVCRELREQRDRLAEALERILSYQGRFAEEDPESIAAEALAAVKG